MFLGESFPNSVTQNPRRYAGTVMAIGNYVGEVFVRNLAGWWGFPDTFQMIVLFLGIHGHGASATATSWSESNGSTSLRQ